MTSLPFTYLELLFRSGLVHRSELQSDYLKSIVENAPRLMADLSWQEQANCLGVDPELFFPERGQSVAAARDVCRGCVVQEDCLEYAMANQEKFGIWGGSSEKERRQMRRKRSLIQTQTSDDLSLGA